VGKSDEQQRFSELHIPFENIFYDAAISTTVDHVFVTSELFM